ncbi:MAG TPA: hypothetical protein VEW08_12330 [Steroidobacteraceae bacterium]|nr:hypothetical protein [Steroidobacteraceae bacterium]
MSKRALICLSILLSTLARAAEEPQWLKDARAREGNAKPAVLKSKDNWFKARVPAKVIGDIEKSEGSYTVELDIGSDQPVYCEIMPEGFDMADMVRRNLEFTMGQVAEAQGKVEARSLESIDAGVFGNVPYLQTQWLYRVNDGTAQRLGGFKQISMEKNDKGIYCAHVDLGYTQSFAALAKAFADTFESTTDAPAPYYEEIAVATMGGKKIGVALTTLERDADGDTKAVETTAMLVPGPAGTLHSQDAVHLEWIRTDSSLINATHFIAKDGELTTSVALNVEDNAWVVDGELDGKKYNQKLKADAQPGTWVAQALGLRKLLSADNPVGAEHTMSAWLADDPGKLTDARTKVIAKAGDKRFKALATAGDMNATVTIDKATGTIDAAEMEIGGLDMTIERVYTKGAF